MLFVGVQNGLDKDALKAMAALATQYDDRTKVDKVSEVMNQVDSVKSVMHNNIQVVLSNTEKMEVVEQKTNDLNEQAKVNSRCLRDFLSSCRRSSRFSLSVMCRSFATLVVTCARPCGGRT